MVEKFSRFLMYGISKRTLFKIILALLIILIGKNVFADTSYDMTSLITSPVNYTECGVGSYTGVELNGATNCWNTKVRNYGTLHRIYFNLPAPNGSSFETDTSYRLTLKMATNDWRNNFGTVAVRPGSSYTNNFVDSFTFVSKQQININFTVPYAGSTTYQTLYVDLPATNTSSLITGETNWNLNSVVLTQLTSSGSSSGGSSSSGSSNQDIINNNNQNTQDIINNQNENNEKIINEISNVCPNMLDVSKFKGCRFYSNSSDYDCGATIDNYNKNTGSVVFSTSSDWKGVMTDNFIPVANSSTYYIKFTRNNVFDGIVKVNYYTSNQAFIRQDLWWNNNQNTFTTPGNASYVKISFENASSASGIALASLSLTPTNTSFCAYGSTTSKIDTTNQAINDVNDTLNNDNVDSNTGSSFFDNFTSTDHGGISRIVSKPLVLVNNLLSNNGKCSNLVLPEFMGVSNVSLPSGCILWNNAPSIVVSLWNMFICGLGAYFVLTDLYKIVERLKDPFSDKVEVMKL